MSSIGVNSRGWGGYEITVTLVFWKGIVCFSLSFKGTHIYNFEVQDSTGWKWKGDKKHRGGAEEKSLEGKDTESYQKQLEGL